MDFISKISTVEDVVMISFSKAPSNQVANILDEVAKYGICVDMISCTPPISSEVTLTFTILNEDLTKTLSLFNKLREEHTALRPVVSTGNTKITLFGEQMQYTKGVAADALCRLSNADVEIQLITTSDVDISILISTAYKDTALSALK